MPAGRPPLGPELVDRLSTTDESKTRLKAILETIAGTKTVEEACAQLDVSQSRFHELKSIALTAAAMSLEPAPRGRPRKQDDPAAGAFESLKERVNDLEQELVFAKTRTVLATAFPHLIKDPNAEKKKEPEGREAEKAEGTEEAQRAVMPAVPDQAETRAQACPDEMDLLLRPEEAKPDQEKKNEILAELVEGRLKAADAEEIEEVSREMLAAPHETPATLDEHIENALPAAIFVAHDRKQQASKKRHKKRNRNRRRARREQEMTVRELAVNILKWGKENGLSLAEVARHLLLSPCTLGSWLRSFAGGRPEIKEVGRKPEIADKQLRRELITLFGTMGPGIGIPTLQQYFPNTPRAELERLKEHYKYAYIKNGRMLIHALKWLKPGTVWAMDFTKFPTPLEGGMQFGLAVRDLSSRCCLELLVTDAEDSKTVIDLLSFLFALFGAPLVIKSDNGPPFASHETKNFLTRCGVFLLLSPPYTPSYNGAIESGFFPIKNFSLLEAARNDRPSAWTMDDVFSAKCRFNAVVRPDDPFGRTPQEIFNGRLGVTDQMRERFRECYLDLQKNACLELGYLLDYDDLSLQQQAEVDRIAIVKALVDQGHLEFRRRRITPVFSRRKCAGIVGG